MTGGRHAIALDSRNDSGGGGGGAPGGDAKIHMAEEQERLIGGGGSASSDGNLRSWNRSYALSQGALRCGTVLFAWSGIWKVSPASRPDPCLHPVAEKLCVKPQQCYLICTDLCCVGRPLAWSSPMRFRRLAIHGFGSHRARDELKGLIRAGSDAAWGKRGSTHQ